MDDAETLSNDHRSERIVTQQLNIMWEPGGDPRPKEGHQATFGEIQMQSGIECDDAAVLVGSAHPGHVRCSQSGAMGTVCAVFASFH